MPHLTIADNLALHQEYNRVVGEVAGRTRALLVDLSDAVPGDAAHYADSSHFRDLGSAVFARAFCAAATAMPAFRDAIMGRAVAPAPAATRIRGPAPKPASSGRPPSRGREPTAAPKQPGSRS